MRYCPQKRRLWTCFADGLRTRPAPPAPLAPPVPPTPQTHALRVHSRAWPAYRQPKSASPATRRPQTGMADGVPAATMPENSTPPQIGMAAFERAARPKRQISQPIRKLNCPRRQRTPCVYIPAPGQRIVNLKALQRQHVARKSEWPTVCPPRRCPKTARHRKSEWQHLNAPHGQSARSVNPSANRAARAAVRTGPRRRDAKSPRAQQLGRARGRFTSPITAGCPAA